MRTNHVNGGATGYEYLTGGDLPPRRSLASVECMAYELSPQTEQYLDSIVAGGQYSSKEAALEAAVAALREKNGPLPAVPDDHMELVEEAVASAQHGKLREFTASDWSRFRQRAHDVAARDISGGR